MTTAIIGTGTLGSVIARLLTSGGETLRLSSADDRSARTLAAEIGPAAVVAGDNRDALQGADAVVLALRFTALKGVIDEIADRLTDKLVVVPSNPLGIDAQGNLSRLLPKDQASGEVLAGWLPSGTRLAMAFGTMSADLLESSSKRSPEPSVLFYVTDDDRAGEEVERLIRTAGFEPVKAGGIEQSSRLEVGGDLHDLVVGPTEARSLTGGASAAEGIMLTHFIVSDDVERSRRFYTDVLGGTLERSGEPTNVALANSWIVINGGGGPTDDKPTVTLETPPDPDRVSSFLNIRVKDIEAVYAEWSARGAQFLTPPKQHPYEIRCYIRDPDGHLIEVGQTTDPEGDWTPPQWLSSTAGGEPE